jgi:hypothetical protein
LAYYGIAYYKTGEKDKAEKAMAILKAKSEHSSVGSPSYSIAAIYTARAERLGHSMAGKNRIVIMK